MPALVVLIRAFWHPCRVLAMCVGRGPGVFAGARPPANFCHPYRGGSCRDRAVVPESGGRAGIERSCWDRTVGVRD